jgi:hypothetical protein
MKKQELTAQIDKLIAQIENEKNSVFAIRPLVQDVYRKITGNKDFNIQAHLSTDLGDGEQNGQRGEMITLLNGLKDQIDLFITEPAADEPIPMNRIGFK